MRVSAATRARLRTLCVGTSPDDLLQTVFSGKPPTPPVLTDIQVEAAKAPYEHVAERGCPNSVLIRICNDLVGNEKNMYITVGQKHNRVEGSTSGSVPWWVCAGCNNADASADAQQQNSAPTSSSGGGERVGVQMTVAAVAEQCVVCGKSMSTSMIAHNTRSTHAALFQKYKECVDSVEWGTLRIADKYGESLYRCVAARPSDPTGKYALIYIEQHSNGFCVSHVEPLLDDADNDADMQEAESPTGSTTRPAQPNPNPRLMCEDFADFGVHCVGVFDEAKHFRPTAVALTCTFLDPAESWPHWDVYDAKQLPETRRPPLPPTADSLRWVSGLQLLLLGRCNENEQPTEDSDARDLVQIPIDFQNHVKPEMRETAPAGSAATDEEAQSAPRKAQRTDATGNKGTTKNVHAETWATKKATPGVYKQDTMMDDANIMKVLVVDMLHVAKTAGRAFFLNAMLDPLLIERTDTVADRQTKKPTTNITRYQPAARPDARATFPVRDALFKFDWGKKTHMYKWRALNIEFYSGLGLLSPPEAGQALLQQLQLLQTQVPEMQLFRVYRMENDAEKIQELVAALLHRLKKPPTTEAQSIAPDAAAYDTPDPKA